VPQDDQKAAQLYRQAAEAGNLTAMSNLAVLYQNGRGVPQDHAGALRLYRKCAEAGSAVGQFNLGTMYHHGLGVPKDDQEPCAGINWLPLKVIPPPKIISVMPMKMAMARNKITPRQPNGIAKPPNMVSRLRITAWEYFIRDGLGVKQDYQEAEIWLKRAVEKGLKKPDRIWRRCMKPALSNARSRKPAKPNRHRPKPLLNPANPIPLQKIVTPQAAARRVLCLRATASPAPN